MKKSSKETSLYSPQVLDKIFEVGRTLLETGSYRDAVKVYGMLTVLDSGYAASWIMLGVSLKMEKKWERSLEALHFVMKIEESNPLPHFHAAICYKELGQRQEAHHEFAKALEKTLAHRDHTKLEKLVREEQSKL